jgi:hypothetical protein
MLVSENTPIIMYDNVGITPNEAVPQWYLDENLQVCWDRITLGGYRLAYLIEYIYPATSQEALFLQ